MSVGRDERRVLVLNPTSGSEDHVDAVVALADEHGFEVRRTQRPGEAERIAREVAHDAELVAACGGDGTLNEVVNGIVAAYALESTTVAVVPAGTGNNFATNVGVDALAEAFDVIERGRRRDVDLGVANDRAFVNSCVGGVTAEASAATTSERKRELGVLAYVVNTIERVASFEPLPLRVETAAGPDGPATRTWQGKAVFVLVGNCRRFTNGRTAQANVEDGLFEVTIVEEAPAVDLVGQAALEWLVGREAAGIVRRRTPSLTVESLDGSVEYSLDGEVLATQRLSLETRPAAVSVAVGERYEPNPDDVGP